MLFPNLEKFERVPSSKFSGIQKDKVYHLHDEQFINTKFEHHFAVYLKMNTVLIWYHDCREA